MLEYNYDLDGIFIDSSVAYLDPLESQLAGKDVFTSSNNATFEEPPKVAENRAALHKDGKWQLVFDYRGKVAHDENNNDYTVESWSFDDLPDDHTLGRYADTAAGKLEKAKADKLAEIKADKHAKYAEPVDYFGTLYNGDPASGQIAFNVYAGHVLAKGESIEDIREWGALEQRVSLNYGDLLNISELIEAKTTKAKDDEYVKLVALEAATTIEEVEAI